MKTTRSSRKGRRVKSSKTIIEDSIIEGKLLSMYYRFAMKAKLHRFQAEKLGDHCLPTTISDLQAEYGIRFAREFVKVRNRFGTKTNVMMYWLEGKDLAKARRFFRLEVSHD